MSYANFCPLEKKECVHCVDSNNRLVCMHREAKINKDGFSLVDYQKKCPMVKSNIRVKKIVDKYNRKYNK